MKLYPSLRYRDARAAAEWLERAFGFELVASYDAEDGTPQHVEMRWGESIVMFGTERDGGDDSRDSHAGRGWIYATCGDPDALFARATDAGADVVRGLTDQDYGSRDFSVRDPEGNLWSFGTYEP
jgi:uncharacterized glyoxalase superfamily protein PhnB